MKRNLIKLTGALLLTTSAFMLRPTEAEAAWIKDNAGWWYTEGNSWANNGWRNIDGNWYYFNEAGYMAENTTIDGYYVDSTGKWVPSHVSAVAETVNTEAVAGTENGTTDGTNAETNNGSGSGANSASDSTTGSTESSDIGEERAKEIAFNHAGVTADSVYALRVKTDYEKKIKVYEIEFKNDKTEYEYEINAASGEIVSSDKEYNGSSSGNGTANGSGSGSNSSSGSTTGSTEASDIGEERAKEIAFNHAGVTADSVSALKVSTDYEKKIKVYEVEFKNGNMEYEYEINASTGSIQQYDSEYDD